MRVCAVIPARLASTRLPRKVLADLAGKSVLQRVWEQVRQAGHIERVFIATDADEVEAAAKAWGAEVAMTSPDCASGTDRIASLLGQIEADFILNVQGDEPFIPPTVLDALVSRWEISNRDIVTAVRAITNEEELHDSNLVKAARAHDGRALYFSRSPIPHARDCEGAWTQSGARYWGHLGVYGFARRVLEAFPSLPPSPLEQSEKLEQLRLLEAGFTIDTIETDYRPIGIDSPEDLESARAYLTKEQSQ